MLILPLIGLLPSMLGQRSRVRARGIASTRASAARDATVRTANVPRAELFAVSPSELYHRIGVEAAVAPRRGPAAVGRPAATLAFVVHLVGFVAFKRMLDMPVSLGTRRGGALGGLWGRTIPGLSPGASAVAFTQLRLAMRTPRGRSILAGPLLIFVAFSVMIYRSGGISFRVCRSTAGSAWRRSAASSACSRFCRWR